MHAILLNLDKVIMTLQIRTPNPHLGVRITEHLHVNINPERYGIRLDAEIVRADEANVVVACPSLQKQQNDMRGYDVEIGFSYEGESYYFLTTIMGRTDEGHMLLKTPARIIKQQRRDDVRHFCTIPVRITGIDKDDIPGFDINGNTLETLDISAGGMRLQCEAFPLRGHTDPHIEGTAIDPNSEIEILFALPDTGIQIAVDAKITWIHRVGHRNQIGIRFIDMPQKYQSFIVQYIYGEQIKERRNKAFAVDVHER